MKISIANLQKKIYSHNLTIFLQDQSFRNYIKHFSFKSNQHFLTCIFQHNLRRQTAYINLCKKFKKYILINNYQECKYKKWEMKSKKQLAVQTIQLKDNTLISKFSALKSSFCLYNSILFSVKNFKFQIRMKPRKKIVKTT